jgi:hypothetical protein
MTGIAQITVGEETNWSVKIHVRDKEEHTFLV